MGITSFPNGSDLALGLQISDNNIQGTEDFFTFGRGVNLPAGSVVYLNNNNGVHVPIESPTELFLRSSNAGDAGVLIRVIGLDGDYNQNIDIYALTSGAVSIGSWAAVFGMQVVGANAAIGNVTASTVNAAVSVGDLEIQSIIIPTDQQAFNAFFLSPKGRNCYLYQFLFTDYRSGGSTGNAEFFLETKTLPHGNNPGTPWTRRAYAGLQLTGSTGFEFHLDIPFKIPEMTLFRIGAEASATNIYSSVGMQVLIKDK